MQLYTKILIGMGVGALLGAVIGPNSTILPQDAVTLRSAKVLSSKNGPMMPEASGLKMAALKDDSSQDWLHIEWRYTPPQVLALATKGITAKAGHDYEGWVANDGKQATIYAPIGQKIVDWTEWIGRLFLALIKMVVVPLVFFSLLVGVASLGDFRALGRLGGRTIGYFTMTTIMALIIGVGLANLMNPGSIMSEEDRSALLMQYEGSVGGTVARAAEAPSFVDQLVGVVPTNPVKALANGDMLQVIFFALMLGVALTLMKEEHARPVTEMATRLNDAMIVLVHIAMKLAPYGVAALLFKVVGTTGLSVLAALGYYALVVVLGLLAHMFITYGTVLKLGARLPIFQFLGAIKEALLVAFSTSSSSATLPVTMEACEENVNVSPRITSFVLPLGATVNMDGTALYQGVAAIFIAQIYGMDLAVGQQVTIVVSATLASIGAAGVPGAGMITLAMVLTAIGVPTEGLALILGVDRLLDMFRTAINVVGDSTACAFMGRLEGDQLRIMTDAEDKANPSKGFEGRVEHEPHPVPVERAKDEA